MSFELVKKLIDEVSSPEFKKEHTITSIQLGENGDAFMNPDFLSILIYIKKKLPDVKTKIFTNFRLCDEKMSKIILEQNLIDEIGCNIDSVSPEQYYEIKKLDSKIVFKNFVDFINQRNILQKKIPMTVNVLSLNTYLRFVYGRFGFIPTKIEDIELLRVRDDTKETIKALQPLLYFDFDVICATKPFCWAERSKIDKSNINYEAITCPKIKSLDNSIFVAPNGIWYACCLDSNNELEFGNLKEQTILEVYNSYKRNSLIDRIKDKQFKSIGSPCDTVIACL
jgi:MoaA/NifB/PqqE/SkfB family radical SAM enzyme